MAGSSLLMLLDDIAAVLDDVALMTKVAAKKTDGVLGDDLALNAQQVSGVRADRELPVVWAVAKGSFRNKAILVPVALAIEIPPTATLVNFSGAVPSVLHADQDNATVAAYGDTQAQTLNVLNVLEQSLKHLGLNLGDVVKMQVYLVGDPANARHR